MKNFLVKSYLQLSRGNAIFGTSQKSDFSFVFFNTSSFCVIKRLNKHFSSCNQWKYKIYLTIPISSCPRVTQIYAFGKLFFA